MSAVPNDRTTSALQVHIVCIEIQASTAWQYRQLTIGWILCHSNTQMQASIVIRKTYIRQYGFGYLVYTYVITRPIQRGSYYAHWTY